MRHWIAARTVMTCGRDGCRIHEGEPVQVIRIGGLPDRFRCQKHADGSVNWAEVDASRRSAPVEPSRPSFVKVGKVRTPFDPRQAQLGERDE